MHSRLLEARGLTTAVAVLSFAAGALVYWSLNTPSVVEPQAEPTSEPPPVPPAVVPPAAAPVERPDAPSETNKLRLPDGSEVEPLNGVTTPAAMTWGKGPYSPIVGTEHGNGLDWYVHADGTRTTTLEVWRPELGRPDPVTLVYRPVVAATVDPGPSPETSGRGK